MTTSHSDNLIRQSDIQKVWTDTNEPDAIGFEASHAGKELFVINFEESGLRSIRFSLTDVEFDAAEFSDLVNEATAKLQEWEERLRSEGGAWSNSLTGRS